MGEPLVWRVQKWAQWEQSWQLSSLKEDLMHVTEEKIRENRQFTINFSTVFFKTHFTLTSTQTMCEKIQHRKLYTCCVHKILMKQHIKYENNAVTFLTRYSEQSNDFLNHIVKGRDMGVTQIKMTVHGWSHTSLNPMLKFKLMICFETNKEFCSWISYLKAPKLLQRSTVKL